MKSIPSLITFLSFLFLGCSPKDFHLPENTYATWAKTSPGLQFDSIPNLKPEWKDRIYPLDAKRLSTLMEVNQIDGIEEVPTGIKDLDKWKDRISAIHSSFPTSLNKLADELLVGIYFVSNLGSTGLTGILRDKNGKPVAGIIYLDADLLNVGGNDWVTNRENTFFKKDPVYSVKIQLDPTNSFNSALSFIILHELGHIVAIVKGYAPDYTEPKRDFRKYPYFEGVWLSETYSPYEDSFFPERPNIKFYQKNPTTPLFPDGKSLYKKLTNTQFVSLYAATNADDTFAEAFAQYVHVLVLKKEYKVIFQTKGEEEVILLNPIQKEGGRKFRELFQDLFAKTL
ncbi:hypothetical protein [Leptospira levettii]|uniref:Lipoprotein n=1 Tax=Leptospira levettii TaxID=2023178 RepID=A0AAW5UZW7_9LEPT|nr:hypothetical protein [Leptospira levettii]MCW7464570.1 hypothetical protein [Leptospira levettii]MCW7511246.1 hypothetical protein [Leptospira levettii]MCW7515000.1 hypothetical protein [Leptospira levettii]